MIPLYSIHLTLCSDVINARMTRIFDFDHVVENPPAAKNNTHDNYCNVCGYLHCTELDE